MQSQARRLWQLWLRPRGHARAARQGVAVQWRRRRDVAAGYAACLLLLVAVYYLLPALRAAAWTLLGLTGVAAIVAGVLINRPARRAPWLLLAAGSLCLLAGQVLDLASAGPAGQPPRFPSPADVCYLASYPLYLAGLVLFIRARAAGRDRRSLVDTLTVTAGAAVRRPGCTWCSPASGRPACPGWAGRSRSATRWATCSCWPCWPACSPRVAGGSGRSGCSRWAASRCWPPTSGTAACSRCTARRAACSRSARAGPCSTRPGERRRCRPA